jgi:hypothetical protein
LHCAFREKGVREGARAARAIDSCGVSERLQLCDATDLIPLLVIEPDDSSHTRLDRQERDAFVDGALAAAGLPILHLRAQRAYVPAELRTRIEGRVISAEDQAVREGMQVRPRACDAAACGGEVARMVN